MVTGATIPKPAEAQPAEPKAASGTEERAESEVGLLTIFREWSDALVIAFVLAMFVRVFVVELFKIPTGSMTPTLIGDRIAEVDFDKDNQTDLVVLSGNRPYVFLNRGDRYELDDRARVDQTDLRQWENDGIVKPQYDRILVNKFAYWLENPHRGDVVIFKTPDTLPWDPAKPIYIKRAVGLPGEEISFDGHLKVNDQPVLEPEFFRYQKYRNRLDWSTSIQTFAFVDYDGTTIERVKVPADSLYVLGDHTNSSLDSRYWGVVPIGNVKGKAFMRYWPLDKIKFIE